MMLSYCYGFLLLALSSVACQAIEYTDHNKTYSIEFPHDWTIQDQDTETTEWVTAQSPPTNGKDVYLESIQITYNQKESITTINEYLPEIVRFMKEKYNAAAVEEIGSAEVGGELAKWILFTAIGPGKQGEQIPLKALHYILVHDHHLMIILCVSSLKEFDQWRPIFEKSIQTLTFKK